MRVPLSHYARPPSGPARAAMSLVFRMLVRGVGGLSVDFAGTYVFDRALFDSIDPPDSVASRTFLYSFQLLERMRRAGCSFADVTVHPFPREAGRSREATGRRVLGMAAELVRHRAATLRERLG